MKPIKPMTPQQALNNFKLFLELSPRNSCEDYRAAVLEIANTCISLGIEGDDEHASAALICAAPELLAALEDCVQSMDRFPDTVGAYRQTCINQARAAISKAKGQQ